MCGEGLREALELLEPDVVLAGHPTGDRLAQRLGLLVDLLEHEVLVAALLGGLRRPVDRRDRALLGSAVDIGDRHAARVQVRDIAVLEEDDLVRVGEDRGDVARQERFAVGQPDDERHILAGADQPVAFAAMHHGDRVRALDLTERRRGPRRRDRPDRTPRRGGRAPRYRSRRSVDGRGPRARREARGSSR